MAAFLSACCLALMARSGSELESSTGPCLGAIGLEITCIVELCVESMASVAKRLCSLVAAIIGTMAFIAVRLASSYQPPGRSSQQRTAACRGEILPTAFTDVVALGICRSSKAFWNQARRESESDTCQSGHCKLEVVFEKAMASGDATQAVYQVALLEVAIQRYAVSETGDLTKVYDGSDCYHFFGTTSNRAGALLHVPVVARCPASSSNSGSTGA